MKGHSTNMQESKNHNKSSRICYVLSYSSPDYIRTRTLLTALEKLPKKKIYRAVNKKKGILRYLETLIKLFLIRIRHNPDIYILGFRGTEIFWPVRILTIGKPLAYDIFISNYDWLVNEHKYVTNSILKHVVYYSEKWMLKVSKYVFTDTPALSHFLKTLYSLPAEKFVSLPVSTDEELFKPASTPTNDKQFKVFFYGTFLPLHGVDVIIKAAKLLEHKPQIKFLIVGKGKAYSNFKELFKKLRPSNIEYKEWIKFEKLPQVISTANLCLGGPFGDTSQAKKVITGKTYQFLTMGKPTAVGKVNWETGFVDKVNSLVVKQNSPEALADAISWAEQNRKKLNDIGLNGKKLFNEKYSITQIIKILDEKL